MTLDSILSVLRALIDISLVWIIAYSILKNIKNNVKMILLLKGVLIVIIVKIFLKVFERGPGGKLFLNCSQFGFPPIVPLALSPASSSAAWR